MSAVDTHMIKFFAHDTNIFSDVSLAAGCRILYM